MSSADERRPVSLEASLRRLVAGLLFATLLVLLAIGAWIGRESAIQFALSRLHHDAEAILSKLDPQARRIQGSLTPIYRQPLSGHYFVVRFDDGSRLQSRSLWDETLQVPMVAGPKPKYWLTTGPGGQRLVVWQQGFEKNGVHFSIAIAEDVGPLLAAIWRFIWIGAIASLAAVVLMLLAQQWLIRRAFRRFDLVRDQVRAIRQGRRERIDHDVPAEVLPLVEELNQLLNAWRQHQARSRNAVGNLAHALKTPLQLVLSHAQREGCAAVQSQAREMQQLIERELKRARLTGRAAVGQHFSPERDLGALVDTMSRLHGQKGLTIRTHIEAPERLQLDQSDFMELSGNLLDNAAKWAESRVNLEFVADHQKLCLTIEDDGPGIEVHHRQALLERGNRADENRPGHGLGLAIVNEIVHLYQGRIRLEESPALGGLRVVVELPLAG